MIEWKNEKRDIYSTTIGNVRISIHPLVGYGDSYFMSDALFTSKQTLNTLSLEEAKSKALSIFANRVNEIHAALPASLRATNLV